VATSLRFYERTIEMLALSTVVGGVARSLGKKNFCDHPEVTGRPHGKFASAPLKTVATFKEQINKQTRR